MGKGKVLFKGKECVLVWEYSNGYCEVEWGEEVILVHKSELTYQEEEKNHSNLHP